jgi:hypothetical protein
MNAERANFPPPVFMGPGLRRDDARHFLALKSSAALLMQ